MDGLVIRNWLLIGAKALFATIGSLLTWRLHALTVVGSVCMGLMGFTILLVGGWLWLIPVLMFFLTSLLLGYVPYTGPETKPTPRTAWQVLANGAVAWVAVVLLLWADGRAWHPTDSLAVYFGALAAANADTWATELGVRFGGIPRDMVSGRTLPVGASGGITGVGTAGAVLGALVIASLVPWVDARHSGNWLSIGHITLAGWLGAMFDSLLGSLAQKRYRCRVCGEGTELPVHCGTTASPRRGFLTNNQVNWFCTSVGAFTAWVWLRW